MIKLIFVTLRSHVPPDGVILARDNFAAVMARVNDHTINEIYLFKSMITGWKGTFDTTDVLYEFKGSWTYQEITQAIHRGRAP